MPNLVSASNRSCCGKSDDPAASTVKSRSGAVGFRIDVTEGDDGVATLEFERGRHNYFPSALTNDIKGEPYANSCERIDRIQP